MDSNSSAQRKVIVIGAGGHARTLLGVLRRMNVSILGMTSKDKNEAGQVRGGIQILGSDSEIAKWRSETVLLVNGVGTDHTTHARREIFSNFKEQGYSFFSTQDPSALVDATVEMGEGCQIQLGCVVQAGARLGRNVIVNSGVLIEHDCIIGDHAHLAPGVVLCGSVHVGEGCFIGAGTVIRQGIKIGEGSTIGAGSLVLADVPAHSVCFGHPAKVIRKL